MVFPQNRIIRRLGAIGTLLFVLSLATQFSMVAVQAQNGHLDKCAPFLQGLSETRSSRVNFIDYNYTVKLPEKNQPDCGPEKETVVRVVDGTAQNGTDYFAPSDFTVSTQEFTGTITIEPQGSGDFTIQLWHGDILVQFLTVEIATPPNSPGFYLAVYNLTPDPIAGYRLYCNTDTSLTIPQQQSYPPGISYVRIIGTAYDLISVTLPATLPEATLAQDSNFCGDPSYSVSLTDNATYEMWSSYSQFGQLLDLSGEQTVYVDERGPVIPEPNFPPIAQPDFATTTQEMTVVIPVLENDSDPDGDTLTVVDVGDPTDGTATTEGNQVAYTPELNFVGTDAFTYTVSDGNLTDTTTVSVTVEGVPEDVPVEIWDGNFWVISDSTSPVITGTATIDRPVEVKLDGETVCEIRTGQAGIWYCHVYDLTPGEYTIIAGYVGDFGRDDARLLIQPKLELELDLGLITSTDALTVSDVVTYTYTFTNTGNVTLVTSLADSFGPFEGRPVGVGPGISGQTTWEYTLTEDDFATGTLTNTAVMTGTLGTNSPLTTTVSDTVVFDLTGTTGDPGDPGDQNHGDNRVLLPLVRR